MFSTSSVIWYGKQLRHEFENKEKSGCYLKLFCKMNYIIRKILLVTIKAQTFVKPHEVKNPVQNR